MTAKDMAQKKSGITEEQVRQFLKSHPDFFERNADMMTAIAAPAERDLGDGIVDFQHYLVKNLQKGQSDLKSRYDVLIDFCRDNMSVQTQVHNAALRLIRARSIEQLLEVVTIDLVNLFDVDIVRLAIESENAGAFDSGLTNHESGIVFIPAGTADLALGKKKNVLLIDDCHKKHPIGFEEIFADCAEMIESCALLRLELEQIDKRVILAFGVRHKNRFHPGQGIELLHFLAQIVAHQLDKYLDDLTE